MSEDELRDDQEFGEITEDTQEECAKFGEIKKLLIPRPGQPGVGRIFVQYAEVASATAAAQALAGRSFGGNVVGADFFDETKFEQGEIA